MDIIHILKENGYNVDEQPEETLEDIETQFTNECEDFIEEYVREHQDNLCFELAGRFHLKRVE